MLHASLLDGTYTATQHSFAGRGARVLLDASRPKNIVRSICLLAVARPARGHLIEPIYLFPDDLIWFP